MIAPDALVAPIAVAPMMDWTDRHCRFFLRQISASTVLYTEMVTAQAVRHGDRGRLLGFDPSEQPVVLQLGGADPEAMAIAAEAGQAAGYAAININVGCPSDRVQSGRFGACLMREPETVAACVAAMGTAVDIPITVKCRIGVDDQDPEAALDTLVDAVAEAGCRHVVVHARKAWLHGLSPKDNRDVPPLDHDRVYRLKRRRPDLRVGINGGITDLDQAAAHLAKVDEVMLGRAAYHTPWVLAEVDRRFAGAAGPGPDRFAVAEAMAGYADRAARVDVPVHAISRHMMGLFQGLPGARQWRRYLSENAPVARFGGDVIRRAADRVARIQVRRPAAKAA
jgi:tRNA-dihydrouridine synthase A